MINSYLRCPEQDSNLHASQHAHLKRARLPFRHLGIGVALTWLPTFRFGNAKVGSFFELCNRMGVFNVPLGVFLCVFSCDVGCAGC